MSRSQPRCLRWITPDSTELAETLVEGLVVRRLMNGVFTAEEFHHDSAWLLRARRTRLARLNQSAAALR